MRRRLLIICAGVVGPCWIRFLRLRKRAAPLSARDRAAMAPFFSRALLDRVRITETTLGQPAWILRLLERAGHGTGHPVSPIGMALGKLVLLAPELSDPDRSRRRSVLLHELVHVVQYDALGTRRFSARYVAQWLDARGDPSAMPLERDAYDMQAVYESAPDSAFDAESEVRRRANA